MLTDFIKVSYASYQNKLVEYVGRGKGHTNDPGHLHFLVSYVGPGGAITMPVKSRSMFNKVKNISLLANFISELINFIVDYCLNL